MTGFFMAGSNLISWEVVSLGDGDTFRLSVVHPQGRIVEYFTTTAAALAREQEIEALILAASTSQPVAARAS
jgi:hypothetical protein